MRGFIAIELDDAVRQVLCDIQNKFRNEGIKGNYSFAENLHLTVKFLGELDEVQYQGICELLKKIASNQKSFVLTLDSIGNFNKENRSIIWAGLKRSEYLLKIYHDVENELERIMPGKREKSYSPHITLVREAALPRGFIDSLGLHGSLMQPLPVSGLSLMESTRVNGRLTYVRRAFEPFK